MKALAFAFLLATLSPAAAQQLNQPRTIKLHNNATGENLGTVTITGNTAYMRNKNGEHVATIVTNPDGTKTSYDPSGKVIESVKLPK
jgi:hypothetical protein